MSTAKVSTRSKSDDYNIMSNMLYFRLMRKLEHGTLSKSIHNFFIDTMYRAITAAFMFPFALCYEILKGIKRTKLGNGFYTLCFYSGVFGAFFTVGIAIAKTIALVDSFMTYLDSILGSSNTTFVMLITFDVLIVTMGYFLGIKPKVSEDDGNDNDMSVSEIEDDSVIVSDIESPTGTRIRVSTRCA